MALPSLNIISLCTGGGGLDLGLEIACERARPVCYVEGEAFAAAQLVSKIEAGVMADAPIWSDVRTFDGRAWRGVVDFVIGGIPCQPYSAAGQRRGADDERDLWPSALRIIEETGAWGALIENVEGILTAADGDIPGAYRVENDLRGLGFSVESGLFSAREVGASHIRKRWFCLAIHEGRLADAAGVRCNRHSTKPGSEIDSAGERRLRESSRDCGHVADARRDRVERRGDAGKLASARGCIEAEGHKRERGGETVGDCGERILENTKGSTGPIHARQGRSEQRTSDLGGPGASMEHAERCGRDGRADDTQRRPEGREAIERAGVGLFPPGPNDHDAWRECLTASPQLEPAFRRMADGLASRLDIGRIDRLRMLGNGVVPLQAAHAIRTLAARFGDQAAADAAKFFIGGSDDD